MSARAQDGLRLSARVYGQNKGHAPVICLPDFIENAKSFHQLAGYLSAEAQPKRQVISIEYRGRGLCAHERNWRNYTLEQEASDLLAMLARLNIGEGHFVANLRGGLILFALTALRPGVIKSVVLNEVGPVIDAQGLVRVRFFLKHVGGPLTMERTAQALKAAHGARFPALSKSGWLALAGELFSQKGSKVEPDFDPKLFKILALLDAHRPLPSFWPQFKALCRTPALVFHAENSDILTNKTVQQMRALRLPLLEISQAPNQGQTPLFWNQKTWNKISNFLNKTNK